MANGNGNGDVNGFWWGMPWWVKAIAIVGVPSLISLGVIWSDRVQLVDKIDAQVKILYDMRMEARSHVERDNETNNAILEATRETNRILLAGCVNGATTIEARERCVGR